jgi:tRNA-specific 2-thiouridylase
MDPGWSQVYLSAVMRIAVGMSGGVDSSVTALLLLREGHQVTGITMSLWAAAGDRPPELPKGKHGCYGPDEAEDIQDSRAVCSALGIEHRVFDCSQEYRDIVLADYRDEYTAGRTPNPCVRCNSRVKFGMLLARARAAGVAFDHFATGHYARVGWDPARGRHLLSKAAEPRKDQSYFLYRLTQEQLGAALFPLGGHRKEDTRRIAREAGLPVSDKAESQDFYSGDYRTLLGKDRQTGPILDTTGRIVGAHPGVWNYTRGQRRGLGVAAGQPL